MISRISQFKPLFNRCLVKKILPATVTKGGIILSDKSAEKEARFGLIIAVGSGDRNENGDIVPLAVKVGDHVLLPEYQGTKVNMEDTESEYMIYKDIEFLGLVEGVKH